MDSSAGGDAGVVPSNSVAKAPGVGASSSSAPTDPFNVDDLCNVMLQHWSSTGATRLDSSTGNGRQQQQPRKRARLDAAGGDDAEESVRLIRGAQIVSISLLPV
ncbi:hypothetical protein CGC20_24335 [Leishmania donovani]|uniref:Uncharacterized protein n=1 Tax=Leishmania donovani TaxID=5661 RepID=A0A504XT32_LEIDO|nr:hypothetical protein CGC20_24335 [Leishmania donovani]